MPLLLVVLVVPAFSFPAIPRARGVASEGVGENTLASPFTKQISFSTFIRMSKCHLENSVNAPMEGGEALATAPLTPPMPVPKTLFPFPRLVIPFDPLLPLLLLALLLDSGGNRLEKCIV